MRENNKKYKYFPNWIKGSNRTERKRVDLLNSLNATKERNNGYYI